MGQINPESWPDRQVLITRRLRQRRAELGLTQKQVVTRLGRCGLQTTNRAVSSLEHGAGVDVAKLPELAIALDCTITYLIGLTDDPHRWEPDPSPGRQPGPPPLGPQQSGAQPPGAQPPGVQPRSARDSPPALDGMPTQSMPAQSMPAQSMPTPSWILGLEVPDRSGRITAGSGN